MARAAVTSSAFHAGKTGHTSLLMLVGLCVGVCGSTLMANSVASISPVEHVDELFAWVTEHGGVGIDRVRVAHFDKEGQKVRGLAASGEIRMGTEVFSVPPAVILGPAHPMVLNSEFGQVSGRVNTKVNKLTLYLAAEARKVAQGADSFWAPVIRTKPTREEYATFNPYYASADLMSSFKDLTSVKTIKSIQQDLRDTWDEHEVEWRVLAKRAGADGLTFEDFKWAWVTFATYCYSAEDGCSIVPISDMANTDSTFQFSSNLNWDKTLSGNPPAWRITATRRIQAGDELTEGYVYGQDNTVFLKRWGFLIKRNPYVPEQLGTEACGRLATNMAPAVQRMSKQPAILANFRAMAREQCRDYM